MARLHQLAALRHEGLAHRIPMLPVAQNLQSVAGHHGEHTGLLGTELLLVMKSDKTQHVGLSAQNRQYNRQRTHGVSWQNLEHNNNKNHTVLHTKLAFHKDFEHDRQRLEHIGLSHRF